MKPGAKGWVHGCAVYHFVEVTGSESAKGRCGYNLGRRRIILSKSPPNGARICIKCERLMCPPELRDSPGRCITCPKEFASYYNRCHGVEIEELIISHE